MRDRLNRAWRQEPWWAEFWAGGGLLLWAGVTVYSGGLKYREQYIGALEVMPSWAWVAGAVVIACWQLWALALDHKSARWWGAGIAAMWILAMGAITAQDFGIFPTWSLYLQLASPNVASLFLLRFHRHAV